MDEKDIILLDDKGQSDFLSTINAEVNKVEPAKTVLPVPQDIENPSDVLEVTPHLKAETFNNQTLPVDWLSPSVQEYILTVAEAYGCPQDYVVGSCLVTAGIAAGKKVVLQTNPYTNYPCDFMCMVGKPSRNKTGPLQEVTRPLREQEKENFAKYVEAKAIYDQNKREDRNFCGEQPVFHQRVTGDSSRSPATLFWHKVI